MMPNNFPDTEKLLENYAAGDLTSEAALLSRHRERLKRLVAVRLDKRVAARIDPSDVVQETLIQISRRLPQYVREKPMRFYPWIRQLAVEQVVHQHRLHVEALGRSVTREAPFAEYLPEHAVKELSGLILPDSTINQISGQHELTEIVQKILQQLKSADREILVLRCLEQLSNEEAAEILELTPHAAKSRLRRALDRFGRLLAKFIEE